MLHCAYSLINNTCRGSDFTTLTDYFASYVSVDTCCVDIAVAMVERTLVHVLTLLHVGRCVGVPT